jgi:ribosomal protein L11 methyltransferase
MIAAKVEQQLPALRTKPKTYRSIGFQVPAAAADEAAGILVASGALGCEVAKIAQRKPNRGSRSTVLLRAYFVRLGPELATRLHGTLESAGMLANGSAPALEELTDPGWATLWQDRFVPLPLGERFLIVPPWRSERDRAVIRIVIQPGQAFGTGHHPSTAGTLAAVEQLCVGGAVENALDVGTGSGILAIAMVKLGVANVTAIDIDEVALANAAENLKLNRVSRKVTLSSSPLDSINGRFALITANILSSTLIRMKRELVARLAPSGHLVLAGILQREAESVVAAYRGIVRYIGSRNDGSWTALIFRK